MATFVLVHGAWHGGWCWQKVIPFLEAAGHEVYAPTLTGLAERASELSPEVGLETHIQDIVGELQEKDLRSVILVGHSYGAIVITGVVDAVPERIAHLVYLDTFVPRNGESLADISPLVISVLRRQAQAHGGWLESRFSRLCWLLVTSVHKIRELRQYNRSHLQSCLHEKTRRSGNSRAGKPMFDKRIYTPLTNQAEK